MFDEIADLIMENSENIEECKDIIIKGKKQP
jgi:hypothetical protein